MKRLWLSAIVGAVGMVAAPAVQAAPIWSVDVVFGTQLDISNTGRSLIHFTSQNTTSSSLVGNATIARITETSSTTAADKITNQNYGFMLKLTDLASHQTKEVWFSGSLSGTLSKTTSNLTNRFYTPSTYSNIRLGKDLYTISIGPIVLPSASNHFQGSLSVHVVDPPIGSVSATPEPSSWVLAGMAASMMGIGTWWRRRRGIPV